MSVRSSLAVESPEIDEVLDLESGEIASARERIGEDYEVLRRKLSNAVLERIRWPADRATARTACRALVTQAVGTVSPGGPLLGADIYSAQ